MTTQDDHGAVVHIAGDWHGNWKWARTALDWLAADNCTTLIHAGDFGYWPDGPGFCNFTSAVNQLAREYGIRIVVVPGNHEDWGRLNPLVRNENGTPRRELVPLMSNVVVAPLGYRLELSGRVFGLTGGAVSIDRVWRTEGVDWWPDERISYADADLISEQEPVDVLVTHDAPVRASLAVVRQRARPGNIPPEDRTLANQHNGLVQSISDSLRPTLHFHGHSHLPDSARITAGPQVVSLGMDGDRLNLVRVELDTLAWHEVEVGRSDPPR